MSTQFIGEGNIGSTPEFKEFPRGNDEPRRLLRLNVYFDNPIPKPDGEFEDRGGFWAPVTWWHGEAEHWARLFQKRMRVLVIGRMERAEWIDSNQQPRETWQINARGIAILPHRLVSVVVTPGPAAGPSDPAVLAAGNTAPADMADLPFDAPTDSNRE